MYLILRDRFIFFYYLSCEEEKYHELLIKTILYFIIKISNDLKIFIFQIVQ